MLRFLKRFGKGLATIAGVSVAGTGAAATIAIPAITTDANTVALVHEIGVALTAFGTLLAAFGVGRKAGASAD